MSLAALLRHRLFLRVFALAGVSLIAGVCVLAWVASQRRAVQCRDNLQAIYTALVDYQEQTGALPDLTFYPDDAQLDPDSLYTALMPYGILPGQCICPSSPHPLRETGICYLWNISLDGKRIDGLSGPRWMLVEVNALSTSVPAPHRGTYNVLFTDGTVKTPRLPPTMP